MADIEVSVSTQVDAEVDRLVEEGEFLTRQEAIEELLAVGIQTHQSTPGLEEEEGEVAFADEMRNPGDEPMGGEDEPEF